MSLPDLSELLDCAVAASNDAAAHAMANLHRRKEADEKLPHDVKLALDRECQAHAEAVIRRRFPSHEILGEESIDKVNSSGPLWIIDPIDGTVNFSHGLRYWCNSIAIQFEGRIVAGVVQAPQLNELYTATLERPSELNGERICVSDTPRLSESLALTGIAKAYDVDATSMDFLRAVGTRVRKVRLMGAAALDICQVAAGRVEGFFEAGINLWDFAGGDIVLRMAGGKSKLLEQLGPLKYRYCSSNALVHDELVNLLESVMKR